MIDIFLSVFCFPEKNRTTMNVAPSVQDFVNDFQAVPPRLLLTSPITDVKYIGAFYARQMNAHARRVRTVRDLLRVTAPLTLPQIRQLLAQYVQNEHANTCIRRRAQNVAAGGGVGTEYHVRDFNFVAFNSLRNLLEAARQLGIGRQGHAARLPAEFTAVRDASTGECSCRQTRAACQRAGAGAGAATCRWRPLPPGAQRAAVQGRPGACEPVQRVRRRRGRDEGVAFPGIRNNEPGQKRRRGQAPDAGQQFVGSWRVPD